MAAREGAAAIPRPDRARGSVVKGHSLDRIRRRKDSERLLRTLKHLIKKERAGLLQKPVMAAKAGGAQARSGLASSDGCAPDPLGQALLTPDWDFPSAQEVEAELREAERRGWGGPQACRGPAPGPEDLSLDRLLDVLTQLQYHTRQAQDVPVCSGFLLGCCPRGECCPLHHTALPYHWQLRRAGDLRWESVQEEAQETLERLYCDPDKDKITLRDRDRSFTANLDRMTIQDETFDRLRRLSTQDVDPCDIFRTTWKYYWRDTSEWKEYSELLSQDFAEASQRGFGVRYFMISQSQKYKVDLNAKYQQNIMTGTKRSIRKRPLFQSIVTLLPYLKTLSGSSEISPSPPGAILPAGSEPGSADCSRFYPETWIPMDPRVDFVRVPMAVEDRAYRVVYNLFHKTMLPSKFLILGILRIQNHFLWDKYIRKKLYMYHKLPEPERLLSEKHLFHGTSQASIDGICKHNFDPRVSGRHATVYGHGSYFARRSSYSHRYAQRCPDGSHYMFLSKVLVGRHTVGKPALRRPPALDPDDPGSDLFNSCVDSALEPQIFVLFDSDQCFPYFLIKYEEIGDTVTVR